MRKQKRCKNTNENAVTLIALIISIIVMLILAGVSINAIVGNNGIITQAQNAKIEAEEAELWEQIQVVLVRACAKELTGDEFVDYCNDEFDSQGLAAIIRRSENDEKWAYVLTYGIYSRQIAYLNLDLSVYQTVAAVESTSEYWSYDYNEDGSITLTVYKGSDTEITIPNIVDGYLVTGLGKRLFMYAGITSVTFSEGLETIGSQAFSNCGSLETVSNFPSTLITIGEYAFYECSKLSSTITFTSSMQSVGQYAFYNCSSMNGTVENLMRTGVSYGLCVFSGCSKITGDVADAMAVIITKDSKEIPDYTFSGMSGLTGTVTIGSNIERIGQYAFCQCTGITGIDISEAETLEEIGGYAFAECISMTGELDLDTCCPNISSIGEYAFWGGYYYHTLISSLSLPSSIEYVGYRAFFNSMLESVILNFDGSIDSEVFYGCSSLTNVSFGSNFILTELPNKMFYGCSNLAIVTIPSSITTIGDSCFYGCTNLATVNFSSNLATIGSNAFYGCTALTTLPLTKDGSSNDILITSLTTISASAFYNCSALGKIDEDGTTDIINLLENSYVTTIGDNAFYGCAYLSGTITNGVIENNGGEISLGASWSYGTGVTSQRTFTLASSTKIADNEFQGTTKFVVSSADDTEVYTIEIPDTVTSIGSNAFNGCTALVEVVEQNESGEETEEISGVETLGSYCFAYCSSLEEAGTFTKVTSIPSYCWYYCSSLTNFDFVDGLEVINEAAFKSTSITEVNFSSSFYWLGSMAFQSCSKLQSVDCSLCDNMEFRGYYIFKGCSSLSDLTLSDNTSYINWGAFCGCGITEIYLPESVSSISGSCFSGCTSLISVTGGKNVSSCGSGAFSDCCSLTSIEGLGGVTVLESSVFSNCSSLTLDGLSDIQWEKLTSVGSSAFLNCTSLSGTITLDQSCTVSNTAFSGLSVVRTINKEDSNYYDYAINVSTD